MVELLECFCAICNPRCIAKCLECPGGASLDCMRCIGSLCTSDLKCCNCLTCICECRANFDIICCCSILQTQFCSNIDENCTSCFRFSEHLQRFSSWYDQGCGTRMGILCSSWLRNVFCCSERLTRVWIHVLGRNTGSTAGNIRKISGDNAQNFRIKKNHHQITILGINETELPVGNYNPNGSIEEKRNHRAVYPVIESKADFG